MAVSIHAFGEDAMEQSEFVSRYGEPEASSPPALSYLADDAKDQSVNLSAPASRKRKGHPLLWGLGGTLLSVAGFVAMILFDQYNSMVSELRNDMKHFNETYNEFVKRETFHRWTDQIKEFRRELQASTLARTQLEQELKATEKTRDELVKELQHVRERLATVEGRQAATPILIPVSHQEK